MFQTNVAGREERPKKDAPHREAIAGDAGIRRLPPSQPRVQAGAARVCSVRRMRGPASTLHARVFSACMRGRFDVDVLRQAR
ncbi:MAG: hypothetical protein HOQ02_10430 [Lysobacter sp.]|nr:hypothetical protein [Lysobacter sp.]